MKLHFNRSTLLPALIVAAISVGTFFIGKEIQHNKDLALFNAIHPVREKETNYKLTSPLLGYSVPSDVDINQYQPLLKIVQTTVDIAKRSGDIDNVSVYFRDMNTNHWFGIDPARQYYPASLMKVPIMMAYLQKAEKDPYVLNRQLTSKFLPTNQSTEFDAPSTLIPGKAYSISKLIQAMITESDNGAMATLFTYLNSVDQSALNNMYDNLGIAKPDDNSSDNYQISARSYGWFFRILYNATYISPEESETALKLLSEATFKDGIVAGVAPGTTVAHKFGEHVITDGGAITAVQMHDCGIVYAGQNPYLLCVMTQTKSEDASKKVIQSISRVIYQNVPKTN